MDWQMATGSILIKCLLVFKRKTSYNQFRRSRARGLDYHDFCPVVGSEYVWMPLSEKDARSWPAALLWLASPSLSAIICCWSIQQRTLPQGPPMLQRQVWNDTVIPSTLLRRKRIVPGTGWQIIPSSNMLHADSDLYRPRSRCKWSFVIAFPKVPDPSVKARSKNTWISLWFHESYANIHERFTMLLTPVTQGILVLQNKANVLFLGLDFS